MGRGEGSVPVGARSSCTRAFSAINLNTTGGGTAIAYMSVIGQAQTAQSYRCVIVGGQPGGPMRDAWRFDPAGCNGGRFTLDHLAPAAVAASCPSFQGALPSTQIKDFAYDGAHGGRVQITLVNSYPNGGAGNPAATNSAQRYFLAGYEFDLSHATPGASDPATGTCGGIDVPACFEIADASWLDLAGNEQPWTRAFDFLTVNDPGNLQHCPESVPLPARARTWGAVKSQYRQ